MSASKEKESFVKTSRSSADTVRDLHLGAKLD
jgi:hypothetical protein